MGHKKKGQLTTNGEWQKHLRKVGKRFFWKGERRAEKKFIEVEIDIDEMDFGFIIEIISSLEMNLERKLNDKELNTFTTPRSGIAYEMILDTINDDSKTKEELEAYVASVVKEESEV